MNFKSSSKQAKTASRENIIICVFVCVCISGSFSFSFQPFLFTASKNAPKSSRNLAPISPSKELTITAQNVAVSWQRLKNYTVTVFHTHFPFTAWRHSLCDNEYIQWPPTLFLCVDVHLSCVAAWSPICDVMWCAISVPLYQYRMLPQHSKEVQTVCVILFTRTKPIYDKVCMLFQAGCQHSTKQ